MSCEAMDLPHGCTVICLSCLLLLLREVVLSYRMQ